MNWWTDDGEDARRRLPANGEMALEAKRVRETLDRVEIEAGPVLSGELAGARHLVERLATSHRAALLVEAAVGGEPRERNVAARYVEGFLLPDAGPLDLSDGYDELVGL